MARSSNPRKPKNILSLRQVRADDPRVTGQPVAMYLQPKGIDRFTAPTRMDVEYAFRIRNLMFEDATLVSRLGTDLMGGNAASMVMQVVDLVRKGRKKVTIRFCLRHLEIFEYGLGAWTSFPIPLTGSERDFFCYTGWADKLLFSNGVDGLWEFDFKLFEAKLVPGGPSAKHLTTFGNRVVASATVERGEDYPLRVRWTAKNDYTRWAESTEAAPLTTDLVGGHEDLYGSPGGISDEAMGVFPFDDSQAWLVRSRSVWQMAVSGNVLAPFRFDRILADIGTPFRQTICQVSAGVIFASRDDVHLLSGAGHQLVGTRVMDDISDEVESLSEAYAAYDVGRREYRLAIENFVWRYRFDEQGWTADEYPFPIRSLSRQIQGVAGIPIDNLPATIDELPGFFPPGAINDLVYNREFDDAMMFVPRSTELTVRENDEPRDTLLTGEETDSELVLETGVLNLDALKAIELHGVHGEYEVGMDQTLVFEATFDDGASWQPYSIKELLETAGSEMFLVKQERVSRKIRLRLRSEILGKLRLLGIAPVLVSVERAMASRKPKPATIEILPSSLALTVGGTQQLSVRVLGANGEQITGLNVTLLSTNNSIATVSRTGLVRAIAEGTFSIVASVRNVQVSIGGVVTAAEQAAVATVQVTPTVSQGAAGTQQQFTATVRDANGNILIGRTVTWSSSTPGFATVNSAGLASLVAAGAVVISATVEGVVGSATLTVTAAAEVVASVEVVPSTFAGDVGEVVQLQAFPKNAGGDILVGKTISWATDAPGVATVSATGLVTLVGAGAVTITATCETIDGTSTGTVTAAEVPVSTVEVAPTSFTVAAGSQQVLTVTLRDVNGNVLTGRVITYQSSNTSVATVSAGGVVLGVAAGSAIITVTSEGKNGTTMATVTAVPVASVTVSPGAFSIGAGQNVQLTATPKDANNNPLSGRVVTWGSSDVTKATVSSSGLVTGVSAGAVTITATSETKQGTSTGTIGAATFSAVNSNSGVTYVPEPNPADSPAELPRVFLKSRYDDLVFAVTDTLVDSGNRTQNTNLLQAAIDAAAARSGNTKIRLPSPFPHQTIRIRKHTFAGATTVVEAISLPAAAFSRADPTLMTNSPECLVMVSGGFCHEFDAQANKTHFVGIKFAATTGLAGVFDLIHVRAPNENILGDLPDNIWYDRCLFRGNDSGTGTVGYVRNGLTYNGKNGGAVDCYIDQIGWAGNESHGIIAYNTPGPLKFVNNFIEATSIGMLIGGSSPTIGLAEGRPSDLEVRRNHFSRRLTWAKDHGSWDLQQGRGIKNHLETKNTNRFLGEGNILESNWADGQTGNAVVFKSGVGQGPTAAGNGSENVTFRHNKVRNSTRFISLHALSDETTAIPGNKYTIYNNLAYRIGNYAGQNVPTIQWLITQFLDDLYIAHNTVIGNNTPSTMQFAYADLANKAERLVVRDNILEYEYIWSDFGTGTAALDAWSNAATRVWERNVSRVVDLAIVPSHPGGTNQYVNTQAGIGFESIAADDYRLDAASPFKGDGDGGSDPGADIDKVDLATSGVDAGVSVPCSLVVGSAAIAHSAFAKPAYVTPVTEPDFGTKFTRVTGDVGVAVPVVGGVWPNKIYHYYSKHPVFTADHALVVLKQTDGAFGAGFALVLDGTDPLYPPLFTRGGPAGGGEWVLHPTLADIAVYLNSSGLIGHWNLRTNVSTTKVVADAAFNTAVLGPDEGNVSYNGQYMAPFMNRIADGNDVTQRVDITNAVRGVVVDLTAANVNTVDWVSISPLGTYIVVFGEIDGVAQRTKVFDAVTGAQVAYWTDHNFGHFDLGLDTAGNEVAFGSVASGAHVGKFIMRRLSTGAITTLTPVVTSFNWHASCRNNLRPGWGYASINDDTGAAFDLEVVAIKLDAVNQIERLGRHRTNNVDFDSAAFACPSPDGKRVVFASNWGEGGGTGRPVATYVIDVRDICP